MNLAKLYVEAANRWPNRLAVSAPDGEWSHRELDEAARRLRSALGALGVGPGDRVGLWHPKGARVVAAMQATLRLGAAYVPLDPGSPEARIEKILADCEMKVVLVDRSRAARLSPPPRTTFVELESLSDCFEDLEPRPEAEEIEPAPRSPQDLAYILYTSGSTGTPKGVCLSHENALAFIRWAARDVGATEGDRFSSHAPFHFDLSVFDLYVPATAGASVHIIPEGISYMPRRLVRFVRERRITVWYSVPSALIMMMDHGGLEGLEPPSRPRAVVFAGEPFPIQHLRRLRDMLPHARLFNYYGPTETNVCTAFEVKTIPEHATSVPIGRAASGDRVWVARTDGSPAAPGEEGELVVEGPTVMLGYWGRDPWSGPYFSGDVVRVLEAGTFAYVGRRDHMVKVRGHRVELGEVEAALETLPEIHRAAAIVRGTGLEARLAVFLVGTGEQKSTLLQVKSSSARLLPRYMIPDAVVWLDALPTTANGKVDRGALLGLLDQNLEKTHAA